MERTSSPGFGQRIKAASGELDLRVSTKGSLTVRSALIAFARVDIGVRSLLRGTCSACVLCCPRPIVLREARLVPSEESPFDPDAVEYPLQAERLRLAALRIVECRGPGVRRREVV